MKPRGWKEGAQEDDLSAPTIVEKDSTLLDANTG
jgi:hypothetical protein